LFVPEISWTAAIPSLDDPVLSTALAFRARTDWTREGIPSLIPSRPSGWGTQAATSPIIEQDEARTSVFQSDLPLDEKLDLTAVLADR
jgi:hypothetical protein